MSRRAKIILALYALLIHAALAVILLVSLRGGNALEFIGMVESRQQSALLSHYRYRYSSLRSVDANVPAGAALFLGDSIVEGLCVSAVSPRAVNMGIGGDTIGGVLNRITAYGSIERAGVVVLAVGINDVENGTDDALLGAYAELLRILPPGLPVVVSALLPVDEAKVGPLYDNERIRGINARLMALAASRAGCVYVDAGDRLRDGRGWLTASYHVGDGLHLSAVGYDIWIDELARGMELAHSMRPVAG